MTLNSTHAEVAIVGAGPVGLILAMLLRFHGVEVRVFEARPGLSRHPKARGVSASSMETFRGLGIESRVREAALPAEHVRFFRGESLVDPDAVLAGGGTAEGARSTPSPGVLCSQDRLEPVLAQGVLDAGADLRFGARVVEVLDVGDRVELVVATGESAAVAYTADYVVGCDGARSLVRDRAGISLTGKTDLARFLSIRFVAALGDIVRGREATSYFIAGGKGGFLAIDNDTQWIYQYPVVSGVDVVALRADSAELTRLVRDTAGLPELEVELEDTMLWRMDACVAETFRSGRLLLAGDSAHQTPPTGGHGMNVGIADAQTLAWQLAAVIRGQASESLLDRYTTERHPVASAVVARSLDNSGKSYGIEDELLLGSGYAPSEPLPVGGYEAAVELGRLLPHVAIGSDIGGKMAGLESTVDRAWGEFRVVVADQAGAWRAAAAELWAAGEVAVSVAVVDITGPRGPAETGAGSGTEVNACPGVAGEGEIPSVLHAALTGGDALLVRPDGHIAAVCQGAGESGSPHQARVAWLRRSLQELLQQH